MIRRLIASERRKWATALALAAAFTNAPHEQR